MSQEADRFVLCTIFAFLGEANENFLTSGFNSHLVTEEVRVDFAFCSSQQPLPDTTYGTSRLPAGLNSRESHDLFT